MKFIFVTFLFISFNFFSQSIGWKNDSIYPRSLYSFPSRSCCAKDSLSFYKVYHPNGQILNINKYNSTGVIDSVYGFHSNGNVSMKAKILNLVFDTVEFFLNEVEYQNVVMNYEYDKRTYYETGKLRTIEFYTNEMNYVRFYDEKNSPVYESVINSGDTIKGCFEIYNDSTETKITVYENSKKIETWVLTGKYDALIVREIFIHKDNKVIKSRRKLNKKFKRNYLIFVDSHCVSNLSFCKT